MRSFWILCLSYLVLQSVVQAQDKIENFRASTQKLAIVDWYVEFVEPSVYENVVKDARRIINRYTRTYDATAVASFSLLQNPGNQYFKPVLGEMDVAQREFLQKSGKDNQVDIFMLGNLREAPTGLELEVQLYDVRINTWSNIESSRFRLADRAQALEELIYRIMNYLDREGFVHPSPQDFLKKPAILGEDMTVTRSSLSGNQLGFVAPEELGTGKLAGTVSIGGEKTPFWERAWFWGLIIGGLATAGGLSYFFLVNQPPKQAEVNFKMP